MLCIDFLTDSGSKGIKRIVYKNSLSKANSMHQAFKNSLTKYEWSTDTLFWKDLYLLLLLFNAISNHWRTINTRYLKPMSKTLIFSNLANTWAIISGYHLHLKLISLWKIVINGTVDYIELWTETHV